MNNLAIRFLIWCCVGLFLSFAAAPVMASEEEEMRYLFAGMLQERAKLKSWSCAIAGQDPENGSFEMNLLSNGESVRFTRTQHLPAFNGKASRGVDEKGKLNEVGDVLHLPPRDDVSHVCDNRQTTAAWYESNDKCTISKSTPSKREIMHLWDPRTAGLRLDPHEPDYREAINNRLKFWQAMAKVERKGELWTVTATKSFEFQDGRLSLTIDTEHGFTPTDYRAEMFWKSNSKFPGKTDVQYVVTTEWKQLDGVWVPIRHREARADGTVVREYNVSWDWINKEIDDKEFTVYALGLPGNVEQIV